MTNIIHMVLDWTEKTMNELNPETDKHACAKAFGLGCIDGLIDCAVFWYLPLLALCYYWKGKAEKK